MGSARRRRETQIEVTTQGIIRMGEMGIHGKEKCLA